MTTQLPGIPVLQGGEDVNTTENPASTDSLDFGSSTAYGNMNPTSFSTIHELVLTVHPREVIDGREYEAEFDVEVVHPDGCPAGITGGDFCPVAAHERDCGHDEPFLEHAFGTPDHLTDDQLAAMNGKRVSFAMSYRVSQSSYPDYEWDSEEEFVYDDARPGARAIVEHMAAGRPAVCARCGQWQLPDGTPGPTLPNCTDDQWSHEETCQSWFSRSRYHETHVCAPCETDLLAEIAPLDTAVEAS